MSQTPTIDEIIGAYVETRDLIASKTKELKAEIAVLEGYQKARGKFLQQKMSELGTTGLMAKGIGSCYTERVESVRVSDWDALLEYAKENDRYDLIKKGVSKTVVLECMGDKRNQDLPPGVDYTAFVEVKVRRP